MSKPPFLPAPVPFDQRRDYSIKKLCLAFPNDKEAIEAMASMHPGKLPRLEPYIEKIGNAEVVLIAARPNENLRWTVVWE